MKYFVDAYEQRSISKAAALNSVSSNSISKALLAIESQLQIQLLKHGKNRLKFLKDADALYIRSQRLLSHYESLTHSITDKNYLTVAMHQSLASVPFKIWIYNRCQSGHFRLEVHNPTEIRYKAERKLIDYGIILSRQTQNTNQSHPIIGSGRFQLFERSQNSQRSTTLLVTRNWPEVDELMKSNSIKYYKKINRIESWELIATLIKTGTIAGYLPDYYIKDPDLKMIKSSEVMSVKYHIHLLEGRKTIDQEFYSTLVNHYKNL